jgi:hypothetical protein
MNWSPTGGLPGLVMPKYAGNRSEARQLGLIISPDIIMFWQMAPWFATDGVELAMFGLSESMSQVPL